MKFKYVYISLFNLRRPIIMASKVFWFSRHELTEDQLKGLKKFLHDEDLNIVQVSQTVKTAAELVELTPDDVDLIAVVLPVLILAEYFHSVRLKVWDDDIDILIPKSKRILKEDGSVEFVYDGWEVITDIKYDSYIFK